MYVHNSHRKFLSAAYTFKDTKKKKATQSPKGKQHCLRHQGRLGVDWFGQDCRDPDNVERNPSDIDASTGARAYMNMAIVTAARTLNGSFSYSI